MIENIARQRLPARPGECPERRGQAEIGKLRFRFAPQRHRFIRNVEPDLRHVRYRLEPGVGTDEVRNRGGGKQVVDHRAVAADVQRGSHALRFLLRRRRSLQTAVHPR